MIPTWYDDWSTAARHCRERMAVSDRQHRRLDGGRVLQLDFVKPLHGAPYAVYSSAPGIKCHLYSVSSKDIDGIRRWKPWRPE